MGVRTTEKPLRVVVAAPDADTVQALADLLLSRGLEVADAVTHSAMALTRVQQRQPDVLVVSVPLDDGLEQEIIRQVLAEDLAAVVVLLPSETHPAAIPLISAGVHGCLTHPVQPDDLALTIAVAAGLRNRLAALAERVAEAEERLADRRVINQAKAMLQREYGLTEEEAYEQIRRISMAHRCRMRTVAETILQSLGSREQQ